MSKFITLISILSVVLGLFSIQASSQALSQRGIIISPAINEIELDKGTEQTLDIKVENDTTDNTYNLNVFTQTFIDSNQEGQAIISPFSKNQDYSSWVKYSDTSIQLQPSSNKIVKTTISVPTTASPGGYYFALTFANKSQAEKGSKFNINQRLTALVFLTVKGNLERKLEFEYCKTDKKLYDPFIDTIDMDCKVKLNGNTHLKFNGNLFTSDDQIPINPEQKIILPNTSRIFDLKMQSNLILPVKNIFGSVGAKAQDNSPENNQQINTIKVPILGSQNLKVKTLYANSNNLETKIVDLNVIFFPWKTLIGLVSMFLLGFSLIIFKRKLVKV